MRAFGRELTAASNRLQQYAEQWSERTQALARAFELVPEQILAGLVEFRQRFREIFPENWRGLETAEFHRVLDMAVAGELIVVWAPRSEVLRRLAGAADHTGRERVLSEERAAILEDVRALLEHPPPDDAAIVKEVRSQVLEAIDAADCGHDRAAATLLASALTLLLHDGFGFAQLGQAFKAWRDEDPEEAAMDEFRVSCLQRTTANALIDTDKSPDGFNRHGAQHGDAAFLTEPRMLAGALLLAAWVREVTWIVERLREEDAPDGGSSSG